MKIISQFKQATLNSVRTKMRFNTLLKSKDLISKIGIKNDPQANMQNEESLSYSGLMKHNGQTYLK